ncbi:MAG: hypothetical protein WD336_05465, partial [Trueperaceae bacterium]
MTVDEERLLVQARERWAEDPDAAAAWLEGRLALHDSDGPDGPDGEVGSRSRARAGQMLLFVGAIPRAARTLRCAEAADDDPDATDGYLTLQRANLFAYRDAPGDAEFAERLAAAAESVGRSERDGPLALAAACLLGELALADRHGSDRADEAIAAFGRARGLSEFAGSEAVSVAPLAGLARAHLRWRNPGRAEGLAARALERAERVGDPAG